jgi:hypothetical protein
VTVIVVSVSSVCQELRPVILSFLHRQIAKNSVIQDNTDDGQIFLPEEHDGQKIKQIIESEFTKNRDFDDYIVTRNNEDPLEIAILKKGDIEQLGLFICGFCAMVFRSEVEKNIHQRVHYFGFG